MTAKTVRSILIDLFNEGVLQNGKYHSSKSKSYKVKSALEQIRAVMPSVEEMIGCYCKWRCTQKDSCSTCPYPYFQMATAIRELIESKLQ